MGGVAALFVVDGINAGAQVKGILVTIIIGLIGGVIAGKIVSLFG